MSAMTSPDHDTISPREAEILGELGNHLTNAQIAQKLHISVRTVESHVSALLRKLGAASRRDLAARGLQAITPMDGSSETRAALAQTTAPLRHNIPSQASSFVGRESELARVTELLEQARLVTLSGPGGVGKTRLALQVAVAQLESRRGGVWFVDLASLSDPSLLAAKAAGVLGVREEPGRPVLETLADHLRNEEILLLLDNCEHVVDEAARLALGLVESCQKISVLATSREPLGIQGERIYRVPSLSLPSPDQEDPEILARSEAVRLFCERAEDQGSGFLLNRDNARPIASLCRRLDGLPLAIELATARMSSLSVSDVEMHLDQRFRLLSSGSRTALPRHQTLRALIDWSYDLLEGQESTVLMRLSVFAGGFDLKAAEAVARGGDADPFAIMDHLSSLVDKSLIYADGSGSVRYRLLETIREYAFAKLTETGPNASDDVRKAHRDYFLSLAEDAAPHVSGANQMEWLDRLELELDNFRLALSYCLTDPDSQPGLRLSAALWDFWHFRDHVLEGVAAICAQVDRPESLAETALRGHALVAVGNLLATCP
jgi:predicted ATPase/DNA-binding CsgD family transcriptional regulator